MKMSNLASRVLVAVIGIPLVVLITMRGGYYFFAFIAIASFLALYEFYDMVEKKNALPIRWLGFTFGFLVNLVFLYERFRFTILDVLSNFNIYTGFPTQFVLLLGVISLFVFFTILIELFRNKGSSILNISVTVFGVLYISLFFGMLIATRELFEWDVFNYFFITNNFNESFRNGTVAWHLNSKYWGGLFIISIFATIWICDSAAYFAGRKIGKHKLFPRVSPNKTWEGAIFGFIFAIITMIAAKYLVLNFLSLAHCIVIGFIAGTIGQIGDLCQSVLKRDAGIKDSSAIIPGHGGVFDRFDSIIFVSPIIYLYLDLIVFYF
jgi:phosphatidate cytidylyltransferase